MKVTVTQADLHHALEIVGHAVPTRTTRPILTNVCLTTEGGRLRLFASDEEASIACWITAKVHQEGSVAMPARLLTRFIGNVQAGAVDLALTVGEHNAHTVTVKSQRSTATIESFDATEFPLVPGATGAEQPVQLDAALLKEMIANVIEAAGDDITKPVLTGVLVQVKGRDLTMVAADTNWLAWRKAVVADAAGERKDIIIPAQTLADLARVIPAQGLVEMSVTARGSQVVFTADGLLLSSRLIDGTYPNYWQIIPKEYRTRAVVGKKELGDIVKENQPFAEGGGHVVVLSIASSDGESLDPGTLTLQATAQDLGGNISTISATVEGPDQQVIYDIRHLVAALEVITTPEVAIEVTSASKPGLIRPVGPMEYLAVLTPFTPKVTPSAPVEATQEEEAIA
jgi:DNA polymerase III subunit beta